MPASESEVLVGRRYLERGFLDAAMKLFVRNAERSHRCLVIESGEHGENGNARAQRRDADAHFPRHLPCPLPMMQGVTNAPPQVMERGDRRRPTA